MDNKTFLETPNSKLWAIENYMENSNDIFDSLNNLNYEIEKEVILKHGKTGHMKRDIVFYSDTSIGYQFSGQIIKSNPMIPFLTNIINNVNNTLGTSFNGILINRYIDGTKNIGAHSDKEKDLDKNNKMVASIAFGISRNFRIRDKKTTKKVLDYNHNPGTLLIMQGEFQNEFTHEIPQQTKIKECRISLTFRNHTK